MSNVYDHAYNLEKALRESTEFKNLKESYEAVMNDPESKKMFESFRDTQIELQEKQMQGLEITDAEVEKATNVVEQVQGNQLISRLMQEEQNLNVIIGELSAIITKPLEEVYGLDERNQ